LVQGTPRGAVVFPRRAKNADQLTVSVPCIPAIRWPGTLQKNVYVPGFSVTDRVLLPPWNVGVAPTTEPFVPCWIVRLWPMDEEFVKSIVTLPALAVSELFVNFSAPLGSAAWEIVAPPPPPPEVLPEVVVELDAGAADDDVLLLLDPPHAATPRASTPALSAMTGNLDMS
jgi:hypothetical protein